MTIRRKLTGLFTVTSLLLAMSASQVAQQPAQQSAKITISPQSVVIPIELVNRHIIVKVIVRNSRPLSFVLDTGDQFAIINLDLAKELGLNLQGRVSMEGAGAQVSTGSFVIGASFTIPGFEGFSQPISMALPIGHMAPLMGRDFDGIIGSELIRQFVLELDYQRMMITFHDKDKFVYAGTGETIPIQLDRGHPIIEARITPLGSEPIKGKFVLDIGSSGALALYSPFVTERHLLAPGIKTIKAFGAGAGGDISGRIGRVKELTIGKFKIRNPLTLFSQDTKGAFASPALAGNIGAQITSRFKLFFDYGHERIIFEPNANLAAPFDRAFSGLRIKADGRDYRTFRITNVLEDSPASEAGLIPNDIIISIDGTPAASVTLTKLNEMFERQMTYKLVVRRGDKTLHVTLTPRRLV